MAAYPAQIEVCHGDICKAIFIMAATNDGQDLPLHHRHVIQAALRDELGEGTKILFDEIYRQTVEREAEKTAPA
jgi:hypothetical protein